VGKIFSIEHIGPHPHQPATILVQIHCRDAGLHRGLKNYETEAERFLGLLNTDLPGRDLSAIAAAHGFRYRWQQTVIADMAQ
jgi:hypothetical protein